MGARLARYTGNDTYAQHAEKTWDWIWGVDFINPKTWQVYDGANVKQNCTEVVKVTYSYNAAVMAHGAAYMYAYVSLPVIHIGHFASLHLTSPDQRRRKMEGPIG